jgi:indolepyruvate ferredoxin oxidoreductase beta subunit
MSGEFSAILCGVGGQGLVLMSNIIGNACAESGIRVITGEQHGLSQRSGSVSIHLRIGNEVKSPLIPVGGGDAILSLEGIETLRYVEYLKDDGVVLMNSRVMHPITDTKRLVDDRNKKSAYFDMTTVQGRLKQITSNVLAIDALELSRNAGNALSENVVLLGAVSVLESFPVGTDAIRSSITKLVPPKARDANLKAFDLGSRASFEQFCDKLPCKNPSVN